MNRDIGKEYPGEDHPGGAGNDEALPPPPHSVRYPDVVCRDVSVLLLALIMPSSLQSGPVQVSATEV